MKKLIVVLVVIILLGCAGSYGLLDSPLPPWQHALDSVEISLKFLEMRVSDLETKVSQLESPRIKLEPKVSKVPEFHDLLWLLDKIEKLETKVTTLELELTDLKKSETETVRTILHKLTALQYEMEEIKAAM